MIKKLTNFSRVDSDLFLNPILSTDGADSYRYIYQLGYTDQTVTCFDTDSHSVVATITLSASKAFRNIQACPRNKSQYVFGTGYYDRIDADPASGTFNTVVQSGSFTANATATAGATYNPFFHGFITSGGELYLIADDHSISLAVATNSFSKFFKDIRINLGRNTISQSGGFGAANGILITLFKSNLLLQPSSNNGTSFSLWKLVKTGSNYYSLDCALQEGLTRIGVPVKIGNYIFVGRIASGTFSVVDLETGKSLVSWALSPTDRASVKFTPVGGSAGRVFAYQRINTNVNLSVVDWATKTDLGDISRAAYKATDENCTRQGIYCPYDKCFYVLGGNSSGTGTVNKLHRYDPTQAIGSMYVASYTVGNNASSPVDYNETYLSMNGIEEYEYPDKAY